MTDPVAISKTECFLPEECGWTHRGRCPKTGGEVYERPDGSTYVFPPSVSPLLFKAEFDWAALQRLRASGGY